METSNSQADDAFPEKGVEFRKKMEDRKKAEEEKYSDDGGSGEGRGDDYLLRACPVDWAGIDAQAPAWEKFNGTRTIAAKPRLLRSVLVPARARRALKKTKKPATTGMPGSDCKRDSQEGLVMVK